MRKIEDILDDIQRLIRSFQWNEARPALFKKLYAELLQSKGCIVDATLCPECHRNLDNDEPQHRNWEVSHGNGKLQIIFTCPSCKIKVPMNVRDPRDKADYN